jgi:O-glycosyl hydrolase
MKQFFTLSFNSIRKSKYCILIFGAFLVFVTGARAQRVGGTRSTVTVNPSHQFQTIEGFGLNLAGPYYRDDQKAMIDMFIDDLGATMFRVAPYFVYSDWELKNDNDDPEVMNWEYYNNRYSSPVFEPSWRAIRYLNSRGIRPVISVWGAAPSWMLDTISSQPLHAVCNPGNRIAPLRQSMYPEFAEQVVSMLMYARSKEGLNFQYFSPLNETDCYPSEGPRVDPDQAPGVLTAVARRLQKEGLGDIRLAVVDQALITNDYITPILKNSELMKQVGAFTFHTYVETSVGEQVEKTKASTYPNIPIWLTEYGDLNDLDRSAESDWKNFSLNANRRALTALNQGANALFYFNAYDDYEECGERICYYGLFHSANQVYYPKKRYYATKQLYHYVLPGSRRVRASTDTDGLTVSAFQNPGGSLVIVGVKERGSNKVKVVIEGARGTSTYFDLYITSLSVNCLKQPPVQIKNGVAEFDLPDEAIFTLVATGGNKD